MSSSLTPAARRVLLQYGKKLRQPKSYLRELPDGRFGLFRSGQKSPRPLARIDTAHVTAWLKADLCEGLVDISLSATGRAFLNRAQGGFLAQHKMLSTASENGPAISQATPLQWLKARKQADRFGLVEVEFEAGERLAGEYDGAAFQPRQTMDWHRPVFVDGGTADSAPDIPSRVIDARRRLQAALDYVGPGLSDIAVAICCAEVGLEACEKGFALPQRSGKIMLKMALMRLSVHYGYQSAAAAAASFRMR